jgi:hypothetical protein
MHTFETMRRQRCSCLLDTHCTHRDEHSLAAAGVCLPGMHMHTGQHLLLHNNHSVATTGGLEWR